MLWHFVWLVKVSDEGGVQNVSRRSPAPLLVHQVLPTHAATTNPQEPHEGVGLLVVHQQGYRRTSGLKVTGFSRKRYDIWKLKTAEGLVTLVMGNGPMNWGGQLAGLDTERNIMCRQPYLLGQGGIRGAGLQ